MPYLSVLTPRVTPRTPCLIVLGGSRQVHFFEGAPPGVKFVATGDRNKVFRRRILSAGVTAGDGDDAESAGEKDEEGGAEGNGRRSGGGGGGGGSGGHGASHPSSRPPPSYSRDEYVTDLLRSRFCLHLQGDTTTSRRLFDAIAAGCIPVIIADGVNLPFSNQLDWTKFTIQVRATVLRCAVLCRAVRDGSRIRWAVGRA